MDTLRDLADHAIRRGMVCAGFAIALVMLMLASDPRLSLQSGALMTAALWLLMWGMALRPARAAASCAKAKAAAACPPCWPSGCCGTPTAPGWWRSAWVP